MKHIKDILIGIWYGVIRFDWLVVGLLALILSFLFFPVKSYEISNKLIEFLMMPILEYQTSSREDILLNEIKLIPKDHHEDLVAQYRKLVELRPSNSTYLKRLKQEVNIVKVEKEKEIQRKNKVRKEKARIAALKKRKELKKLKNWVDKVNGEWKGSYICGQGRTPLILDVKASKGGSLSAIFKFEVSANLFGAEYGTYSMKGRINSKGQVTLKPYKWIKAPSGYYAVELRGDVSQSGYNFTGKVSGRGCKTFKLWKKKGL